MNTPLKLYLILAHMEYLFFMPKLITATTSATAATAPGA